jgi:hypothetical protein
MEKRTSQTALSVFKKLAAGMDISSGLTWIITVVDARLLDHRTTRPGPVGTREFGTLGSLAARETRCHVVGAFQCLAPYKMISMYYRIVGPTNMCRYLPDLQIW